MIKVLGDRVLVALPPAPDELTSAGGLVLVRDPDRNQKPTQGIVVAVGEKTGAVDIDDVLATLHELNLVNELFYDVAAKALKALSPAPFDVQIDDCVLFPVGAGEALHDDGIDYVILREAEIIGVLEPKDKEAA